MCVQANCSPHYTGPEQHRADSLMMLSEASPVILQAAGFGLAEPGLFDQTTGLSPFTHTHKEQKVSMPQRVSKCGRLWQQRGNCCCKCAGLSTTVDTGKKQGGRIRSRSAGHWATQLEVQSQTVGSRKSKFY